MMNNLTEQIKKSQEDASSWVERFIERSESVEQISSPSHPHFGWVGKHSAYTRVKASHHPWVCVIIGTDETWKLERIWIDRKYGDEYNFKKQAGDIIWGLDGWTGWLEWGGFPGSTSKKPWEGFAYHAEDSSLYAADLLDIVEWLDILEAPFRPPLLEKVRNGTFRKRGSNRILEEQKMNIDSYPIFQGGKRLSDFSEMKHTYSR